MSRIKNRIVARRMIGNGQALRRTGATGSAVEIQLESADKTKWKVVVAISHKQPECEVSKDPGSWFWAVIAADTPG